MCRHNIVAAEIVGALGWRSVCNICRYHAIKALGPAGRAGGAQCTGCNSYESTIIDALSPKY